jgi:hypothetical protein
VVSRWRSVRRDLCRCKRNCNWGGAATLTVKSLGLLRVSRVAA